jgi:hypothetical protein
MGCDNIKLYGKVRKAFILSRLKLKEKNVNIIKQENQG